MKTDIRKGDYSLDELEFFTNCIPALSEFGSVELVYLTAEFQPFSNQRKPDLLFSPLPAETDSGPLYFVELRLSLSANYVDCIPEHVEFVQESLGQNVCYVFATSAILNSKEVDALEENDIFIIDKLEAPREFQRQLLEIVDNPNEE